MLLKPMVLILAGHADDTEEIAARLAATKRVRVMISEPGKPRGIPADVTRGPFASTKAMAEMLEWDQIRAVVDVSDPYDPDLPAMAADACQTKGVPRLRYMRPGWDAVDAAGCTRAPDLTEAARRLPLTGRAFLAIRPVDAEAFEVRRDVWYCLRIHRPMGGRFPLRRGDYALGAPPFRKAHERQVLVDYRIGAVVAQDTGLGEGVPLLDAARELEIPVTLVDRPQQPRGKVVDMPQDVVDWVLQRV